MKHQDAIPGLRVVLKRPTTVHKGSGALIHDIPADEWDKQISLRVGQIAVVDKVYSMCVAVTFGDGVGTLLALDDVEPTV